MLKNTKAYLFARALYYKIKNTRITGADLARYNTIHSYKNRHCGEKCFIVGNGPSLNANDLSRIYKLGIPTFACNRIHLIFTQTQWRPTYYFISDEKIVMQYPDYIDGVPSENRFFPKDYEGVIKNGIFYNTIYFDYENEGRFSKNAAKGIYPAASITTEMIQFAFYMGFKEIYLIGVDFNYSVMQQLDSKTYSYQGENNYFAPGYLKPGEVADMPNINANLYGYNAAKIAIESVGRGIFNATRGGKLEVFKRVDLDELLDKWEGNQL